MAIEMPERQARSHSTETFRLKLRSETYQAHQALEASSVSRKLLSNRLSVNEYYKILEAWYCAWSVLERAAVRLLPLDVNPQYLPPQRSADLIADMRSLSHVCETHIERPVDKSIESHTEKTHAADGGNTPRGRDQIMMSNRFYSPKDWYGISYVLLGSINGSKVIAKKLHQLFFINTYQCSAFFNYNAKALNGFSGEWSTWLKWMCTEVEKKGLEDHTIRVANRAFTFVKDNFNRSSL